MSAVFADTFFFLAILNLSDAAHGRSSELSRRLRKHKSPQLGFLTEVGDAFARDNRQVFLDLMQLLQDNPLIRVVGPSPELFAAGRRCGLVCQAA